MATKIADLRKEIKDLKEEIARLKAQSAATRAKPVKISGEQLAEVVMKRLELI